MGHPDYQLDRSRLLDDGSVLFGGLLECCRLECADNAFIVSAGRIFGFMGPLQNWFIGLLALFGFAVYVILLSIRLNKESRSPPKWLVFVVTWVVKNFRFDASTAKPAAVAVAAIFSFTFFIFIPIVIWFYAANLVGGKQLRDEICATRTMKKFPATLKLFDGSMITGKFLERSEKVSVLLNSQAIYVVTVGEKPQLLDTTSILDVQCNKAK